MQQSRAHWPSHLYHFRLINNNKKQTRVEGSLTSPSFFFNLEAATILQHLRTCDTIFGIWVGHFPCPSKLNDCNGHKAGAAAALYTVVPALKEPSIIYPSHRRASWLRCRRLLVTLVLIGSVLRERIDLLGTRRWGDHRKKKMTRPTGWPTFDFFFFFSATLISADRAQP